jgi:hypothetical protein
MIVSSSWHLIKWIDILLEIHFSPPCCGNGRLISNGAYNINMHLQLYVDI